MNLSNLGKDQSSFLDFLRGSASILVMMHHVKNSFFTSYESLDKSYTSNLVVSGFYFLTGFGRLPVIFFFVLSGFFISRSIFKMLKESKWTWKKYLIDRLTRLEIVLIPALLLTVIWDNFSKIVINDPSSTMEIIKLGIFTFIGNIFFLQTIFVDTFGSNYPLWSLSNEFWYYIIFPLLFTLFHTKLGSYKDKLFTFVILIITLSIITIKNIVIIQYFLIWLLGLIPIFAPVPRESKFFIFIFKNYKLVSSFLILLTLIIFRKSFFGGFLGELVASCVFSFIIYVTVNSSIFINSSINLEEQNRKGETDFFNRFSGGIAGFSYTLYLVHVPIINFFFNIFSLLGFSSKWNPDSQNLIYYLLMSVVIVLYAMIIARLTEANTNKFRLSVISKMYKSNLFQI